MEACENYQKQSYRNRCRILTAGGVQDLRFPVKHREGTFSLPIREIEVDYSTPWVEKAERCIDTAYHSSAWFDYYRDELYAILDARPRTLWELDMGIIRFLMGKFGLKTEIVPTAEYAASHVDIHPKRPNAILAEFGLERPYYQVFSEKFGFVPNLSATDLLFNEGPGALEFILPDPASFPACTRNSRRCM